MNPVGWPDALENSRARELIDEAGVLAFGPERVERLKEAIAALSAPGGGPQDDLEARGVALALLAESDPARLPEAEKALAAARAAGAQTNWISLHLVDAYYRAHDYGKAVEHAREVEPSYFTDDGLRWRSVKVTEILAASLLARGDLDEGLDLALKVIGELASHDDDIEDVLVPPYELAFRALDLVDLPEPSQARDVGYAVLDALSASFELPEWFPPSFVNRIMRALTARPG